MNSSGASPDDIPFFKFYRELPINNGNPFAAFVESGVGPFVGFRVYGSIGECLESK